jgi:photosystem II stability/assembly factor-like uncharacterized protein
MLISTHAIHATLPAPFIPALWEQTANSTFGLDNVNAVSSDEGGRLLAVGNAGKIASSNDSGITWSAGESYFLESNIYAVSHANGLWVIGGSTGKLATSPDGLDWTLRSSSFGASVILGITYSPSAGLWIAVGGSGKLATSPDAMNWTQRSSSFSTSFINTVYATNNLIVAAGFDGKLATSTNGINWTQRSSSFVTTTIYSISSRQSGTQFVAVGDSGKVANSANGLTWTQSFPGTSFGSSSIRAVGATEDSYVAGGSGGKIATSTDTVSWQQRNSTFGIDTINGIYARGSIGIAVGDRGKIAYSV